MSSNILPRSNKNQKFASLVRQESKVLEMHEKLSVISSGSNRDGDRESGIIKKPRVISQRRSQLPQRSSTREPTIIHVSLADADVSNTTREALREPGIDSNFGNVNGSSKHETVAEKPFSRNKTSMLPPMKPVGRSVSVQTQDSNRTLSSVGIQRSASTRDKSAVLRPGISRSSSQSRPSVTGIAKPAQNISFYQANHDTAPPAPKALQIGLALDQGSKSRTDQTYSQMRNSSELKPISTADTVSRYTRSKTQPHPTLSVSDPSILSTTESVPRKSSGSYEQQQLRAPVSTLQQRFSPAKKMKVPTTHLFLPATNKHGGSHDLSSGDVQIQTELIQSYLLLRSATEVQHQWERSAKLRLESHFELVRQKHVELDLRIKSQQADKNHSALVAWCDAMSRLELANKLQLLSRNAFETSTLLEPGGRFMRVLDSFERWFSRAHRIRKTRKMAPGSVGWDLEFIENIGDDWKLEVATLEMKLASKSRELTNVVMPPADSNLACFLLLSQNLVRNLLEELDVIRCIERDVMAEETTWIESAVLKLPLDADDSLKPLSSSSYQGVWHGNV